MVSTLCGVSYRLSLEVDELSYLFRPDLFVVMIVAVIVIVVMIARSVLYEDDSASYHGLIA